MKTVLQTTSLSTLRGVFYTLMLTTGLLMTLVLNQTLKTISYDRPDILEQATFQVCNGTICQTILSEK
jgi:hypothetical protein